MIMPGKKLDNRRAYPDATRQPRHLDSLRKSEALARQEAYDKLTLEEKIARLPPEPHAKKQRARLLALLEKRSQPKQEAAVTKGELQVVVAETAPKQKQTKKYMKGAREKE
jgi:hypothetical protein